MTLLEKFIQEQNDMNRIYKVVSKGKDGFREEIYESEQALLSHYEKIGELHNDYNREELQGTPKLAGLLGAMYDGIRNGKVVIRYETQAVYNLFSN